MSELEPLEAKITQCLARGYGHIANDSKTLDPTLVEAMAEELMIMFDKELPTTVTLKYENFAKNKSTVTDLLNSLLK